MASDVWCLHVNSWHAEVKARTEGLDVIFILFQLLGAESLLAGSVWSHWDALHLSEEGRSHWDRAAVLSTWRHPLNLLSLSFSLAVTVSISSLPLALILSTHFPSILFLAFFNYFMPLSCVCFGGSLIVFSAVQSTGIKVLFCRPMPFFICCCTSHAGCSIITNNKMTGFYMFDMWMCVCECNVQMCAAGVCVWKNCRCAGISVLMPLSYSAPYQPLNTFLQTNAWVVCVCVYVCLLVCLAMTE